MYINANISVYLLCLPLVLKSSFLFLLCCIGMSGVPGTDQTLLSFPPIAKQAHSYYGTALQSNKE